MKLRELAMIGEASRRLCLGGGRIAWHANRLVARVFDLNDRALEFLPVTLA